MLQQHAANQRTERRAAGTDSCPQTKRHITLVRLRKGAADPGQGRRHDHCRPHRQQRAGGNQRLCRGRKRRRQRRGAKNTAAEQQQPFKADFIAQCSHRQHHTGHYQRININNPQQLVTAGPQRYAERWRSHVENSGVNRHRNINQQNRHQRQPLPRHTTFPQR